MLRSLVGSEMCIRDSNIDKLQWQMLCVLPFKLGLRARLARVWCKFRSSFFLKFLKGSGASGCFGVSPVLPSEGVFWSQNHLFSSRSLKRCLERRCSGNKSMSNSHRKTQGSARLLAVLGRLRGRLGTEYMRPWGFLGASWANFKTILGDPRHVENQ